MCSNNQCDLNCVCSFRMSFLFVFVCFYISNCSREMCIRDSTNTVRQLICLVERDENKEVIK